MGGTPPSPLSPLPACRPAAHLVSRAVESRPRHAEPPSPSRSDRSTHITSHHISSPNVPTAPPAAGCAAQQTGWGAPPMTRSRSAWIAVVVVRGVMSGRGGQRAADARPRAGQGQGCRVRAPGTPEVARDQAARREGERRRVEERSEGRGKERSEGRGKERSDRRGTKRRPCGTGRRAHRTRREQRARRVIEPTAATEGERESVTPAVG
jgi:hypothetical protein